LEIKNDVHLSNKVKSKNMKYAIMTLNVLSIFLFTPIVVLLLLIFGAPAGQISSVYKNVLVGALILLPLVILVANVFSLLRLKQGREKMALYIALIPFIAIFLSLALLGGLGILQTIFSSF
jgi:hypothetical protein